MRSKHTKTSQPNGNPAVTTTYCAGAQEAELNNGQATVKTYWPYGLGVEIDQPGSSSSELNWSHHDRLGSIISISDSSGNLKEKLAYDSWGKRRTTDGSATPDNLDGQVDNKGYTGHEMLDQLDLVHMNGRIYDPLMARFLSADPMIQDPLHSQSYNRYTYVWNNPTNLTDPTGYRTQDDWIQEELKRQAAKDPFGNWSVTPARTGSVTATVLNTENKNNNSLDHSAKPPEDAANNAGSFLADAKEWVRGHVQQLKNDLSYNLDHPLETFENATVPFGGEGAGVAAASEGILKGGGKLVSWLGKIFGKEESLIETAAERANQIHSVLDPRAQRARTTAVTETEEGVRVVSSSERRLSPAQRALLKSNEVEGVGVGHAEVTGVNAARQMGLTPTGTAASRPICSGCANTLQEEKITTLSPLK
ncbi:RHS repeat domain-containing protein [Undibacterium sp. WLHG33]|uniref:RHS repeat domain-containing protein n=1 Tax=Undibacterium sp. WLHG33 TaxID=3412482 RepID=UPI003C2B1907